ncbi:MAG TPA: hypothetical protein DIU18_06545, partial [Gemmatimonadetes bacterium]|nr:hypothetical protein [Gemmatimonadota bacterium]
MMLTRTGGFGVLMAAAVGTLVLLPANGLAQAEVFRVDPCTSAVLYVTRLAAVSGCAAEGNALDQHTLGVMYANGIDVVEDDAEAVRWFRMAAEQGHPEAQHDLGLMYAEGDGVPEDDVEAVRWYRLAAEQGYVPAYGNLGVMYDNGYGVPENDAEALRWYRLAAKQQFAPAQ